MSIGLLVIIFLKKFKKYFQILNKEIKKQILLLNYGMILKQILMKVNLTHLLMHLKIMVLKHKMNL